MFLSFNRIKDKEIILERYPNKFFDMMIYYIKNIKYYLCCCCLTKGEKISSGPLLTDREELIWARRLYVIARCCDLELIINS